MRQIKNFKRFLTKAGIWEPAVFVFVTVTVSVDPCDMLKNFCFLVTVEQGSHNWLDGHPLFIPMII